MLLFILLSKKQEMKIFKSSMDSDKLFVKLQPILFTFLMVCMVSKII